MVKSRWAGAEAGARARLAPLWVLASRLARVMTRGVPDMPAEALGLFRIFFATTLAIALLSEPLELVTGHVPDDGQLGWTWVRWLASRPDLMALLEKATFGLLLLVAVGLFTRFAYLLAAVGVVVWMLVWIESQHSNAHPWLVLLVTVICLVPVRWEAAFSLDETLRRWRGRGYGSGCRGTRYGYAVWIPGLVLGSVWAMAAYAKMDHSGIAWILTGAVKYHWVIDAHGAVVDWASWVARHHWAAVVFSFCAVFLESVFILAVFARSDRWRMIIAAAGLALFIGFYLFQGLVWTAWYIVYLSFVLPWARIYAFLESRVPARTYAVDMSTPAGRRAARFRHGLDWFNRLRVVDARDGLPRVLAVQTPTRVGNGLSWIQWALTAAVCTHAGTCCCQPASAGSSLYSNTYSSISEFRQVNPMKSIYRLWVRYGTADPVEVTGPDSPDPVYRANVGVDAILRVRRDEPLPPEYANELRGLEALDLVPPGEPRYLTLTEERRTFDWTSGQFTTEFTGVTGVLDVESMTLVGDAGD